VQTTVLRSNANTMMQIKDPGEARRIIRAGSYSVGPSLGLMLGGIPAVLVAGLIVKSLPLTALRWLVVAVVAYAASAMLRSARSERTSAARDVESSSSVALR